MTNNEYYGKLNDRYDARADVLRQLGYKYERVEEYGIAVFVLRRPVIRTTPHAIPSAVLLHAEDRAWDDILAYAKRFTEGG